MSAYFLFHAEVHGQDGVITPDILVGQAFVSDGRVASRVALDRLTCAGEIEVLGEETRPDAALVLVAAEFGLLVGVGSAHFDRSIAAGNLAAARQLCPKPLGRGVRRYKDLADDLPNWVLRATAVHDGRRAVQQEGRIGDLAALSQWIRSVTGGSDLAAGQLVMCVGLDLSGAGTPSGFLEVELEDPSRNGSLVHQYSVHALNLNGRNKK